MDVHTYVETMNLLPRSKSDGATNDDLSESQKYSCAIVLLALGFMYSVHNLIAPNMTLIAKSFHFNNYERDAYIGGELTMFFYFPGVIGALIAGLLSGMFDRRLLMMALALMTSMACLLTARVGTFGQLAWARAITGFGIGGALPVVYSLVGDWFPARRRASATAYVTAASGFGVFLGQCIAALTGTVNWRLPFLIIAFPSASTALMIWYFAEEPVRGGREVGVQTLHEHTGVQYVPAFSMRHFRSALHNKTNLLVILQAFPGNIPWGVIIVYIHDFLIQDLGLSYQSALGAIATLSGAAFVGIFVGGFIGEQLYGANTRYLAIFGGVCNILRALPFFILFGWTRLVGPVEKSSESAFFALLMVGGFVASMASPCTGAMLLNVNLPETRGSIVAMYSVLDDLSKGFGTLFVAMIVPWVGGRAVAYQMSLLLWVVTGAALMYTWYTYDDDEQQMRKNLDEAAMESMILHSKQRAQQAIRDRAKAAGEAHFVQSRGANVRREPQTSKLRWPAAASAHRSPTLRSAGGSAPAGSSNAASSAARGAAPLSLPPSAANSSGAGGGQQGPRQHFDKNRLKQAVRAAAEAAAMGPRH